MRRLKNFRIDQGLEYCNKKGGKILYMKQYQENLLTLPYIPENNGKSERFKLNSN